MGALTTSVGCCFCDFGYGGRLAVRFAALDWQGNPVRLADFAHDKVLLSFFRFSACAICNLRVHQMIERWAEWEQNGLKVLAVFESTPENIRQYVGSQNVPFPLIADPEGRLYDLYQISTASPPTSC